jgi:hypothetical protein
MGKSSLIKSTEKKKATSKKSAATPKKTPTKTSAAAKATPPSKATAKKSARSSSPPSSSRQITVKDLTFKKFEPLAGKQPPAAANQPPKDIPPAPPLISTDDPKEKKRLKSLLMARFSMEDIKAAASKTRTQASPQTSSAIESKAAPKTEKSAETPKATPQPSPSASQTPPQDPGLSFDSDRSEPDPMQRVIKYGAIAFVVLVLLLVGASYKNSGKYYIVSNGDAIEIWRGRFSPMGKERLVLLHGVTAPQDANAVYSRNHVFPLAFNYYLEKADSLLDGQGAPNYEEIKEYLRLAQNFAITDEMRSEIRSRMNTIDLMTLLYKIDVAIRKGTAASLDLAAKLTQEAAQFSTTAAQTQLLDLKTEEIKVRRAALGIESPPPATTGSK